MRNRRSRAHVTGLVRRGERAYYGRMVAGVRVYRSLGAAWGSELATQRASALNTLVDRGDYPVVHRFGQGEVEIAVIARAVRDGNWSSLKRVNADGVLLGPTLDAYMASLSRRPSTVANYRIICEAMRNRWGDDQPMTQVTTEMCRELLGESGWAPSSQRLARIMGGAVWKYAADTEAEQAEIAGLEPTLRRNPWKAVSLVDDRKKRPQVLTQAEFAALLAHPDVAGTREATLIAIAGLAGLRAGEICHLRLETDVDLANGILHVTSRSGEHGWDTKTDRSDRKVRIPAQLVALIRDHIKREYASARYLIRGEGLDRPLTERSAADWCRRAFEAAGIRYGRRDGEGLTLHSLRHSHATWLLAAGVSIAVVAERLGDSQAVVLTTYSHALNQDHEMAVQVLDGMRNGKQ